jgi:hypothetical protein
MPAATRRGASITAGHSPCGVKVPRTGTRPSEGAPDPEGIRTGSRTGVGHRPPFSHRGQNGRRRWSSSLRKVASTTTPASWLLRARRRAGRGSPPEARVPSSRPSSSSSTKNGFPPDEGRHRTTVSTLSHRWRCVSEGGRRQFRCAWVWKPPHEPFNFPKAAARQTLYQRRMRRSAMYRSTTRSAAGPE